MISVNASKYVFSLSSLRRFGSMLNDFSSFSQIFLTDVIFLHRFIYGFHNHYQRTCPRGVLKKLRKSETIIVCNI
jgi:hypothetical protein